MTFFGTLKLIYTYLLIYSLHRAGHYLKS